MLKIRFFRKRIRASLLLIKKKERFKAPRRGRKIWLFYRIFPYVGSLAGDWLAGWLAGWLLVCLAGRLRLAGCLAGRLRLPGWPAGRLADRLRLGWAELGWAGLGWAGRG